MSVLPLRNIGRDGLHSTSQNRGTISMQRAAKSSSRVIKKRAASRAIPLSVHSSARLDAPVTDSLLTIGEESKRNRTDKLSSEQIDRVIRAARTKKSGSRS